MPLEWEIWLDSHLSPSLAGWIVDTFGVIAKSAYVLQLHGLADNKIFDRAKAAGKVILISKDADFLHLLHQFGPPPKFIKLNTGNRKTKNLQAILEPIFVETIRRLTGDEANIVFINEHSILS